MPRKQRFKPSRKPKQEGGQHVNPPGDTMVGNEKPIVLPPIEVSANTGDAGSET